MQRVALAGLLLVSACAGTHEQTVRDRLATQRFQFDETQPEAVPHFDGGLGPYVAHAVARHPRMEAAYYRWRASAARIDQGRRIPDPTLTYTGFVRRVETRVGPQRHKLSLRQQLPFPTVWGHGTEAASLDAAGAGRQVDAVALTLTAQVSDAYWELWRITRVRKVLKDQAAILDGLSVAARARLEVGTSGLTAVAQVGLLMARNAEAQSALDEAEARAQARLREALALRTADPLEVDEKVEPVVAMPKESPEALREAGAEHPAIDALALQANAHEERAELAYAKGLPTFSLGFDWIETGPALDPALDGSGRDAVTISAGISIPLWRFSEDAAEEEARAMARSTRAEREALVVARSGAIDRTLSKIRDQVRRVKLYRDTLQPQAEAVLESALAEYQVGNVSLATAIMAQRDLLEVQMGLFEAQAAHARSWSELEHLVGRKVEAGEAA